MLSYNDATTKIRDVPDPAIMMILIRCIDKSMGETVVPT